MEIRAAYSSMLLLLWYITSIATTATSNSSLPVLATAAAASPASWNHRRSPCAAMFNFGDSNSDTGGMSDAALKPVEAPNGMTYFHKPSGRPCDGRLIVDFMANGLGLPFLSGYLQSLGSNFSHGVNFATSSATMGLPLLPIIRQGPSSPFDIHVQTLQFNQFKAKTLFIREQGGLYSEHMVKEEDFPKSLYTFDIGQNDIAAMLYLNMSFNKIKSSISDLMDNFIKDITSVYDMGARLFWIHNTGPLGCMAYVLARIPFDGRVDHHGCSIYFNNVSQHFNKRLKEAVLQLREGLPLATFTYVDIYSVKYLIFTDPTRYGFQKDPLMVCCGHGGRYKYGDGDCGKTITVEGKQMVVKPCKNPSAYVNWDGTHLTEAANKFIYHQISTGKFSDPPSPLKMACTPHHG